MAVPGREQMIFAFSYILMFCFENKNKMNLKLTRLCRFDEWQLSATTLVAIETTSLLKFPNREF